MVTRSRRAPAVVSLALVAASAIGSVAAAESPPVDVPVEEPGVDGLVPFSEPEELPVPDLAIDRWTDIGGQSLGDVSQGAAPTETFEQVGGFEASPRSDQVMHSFQA